MNKNTTRAIQILNQANNMILEVTKNISLIDAAHIKPLLFKLENSLNLLTNEINLGIIIQDEPGGESKKRQLSKGET